MDLLIKKMPFRKDKYYIPDKIQLKFLKQLSRLLANGYSILNALNVLTWDHAFKNIAKDVSIELENGLSISHALEKLKFNKQVVSYLYSTSQSGNLSDNLTKCAQLFEKQIKHFEKFKSIIRYPLVLVVIFGVLLYFIRTSVLPSFLELFQTNKQAATTVRASLFIINAASYIALTIIVC